MPPKKRKPDAPPTSIISTPPLLALSSSPPQPPPESDPPVSGSSLPPTPRDSPPPKKSKVVDLADLLAEDSKRYTKKELSNTSWICPRPTVGSTIPGDIETWVWTPEPITHPTIDAPDVVSTSVSIPSSDDPAPSCSPPPIALKKITVALGLYKIVDEILQNAADNVPRTRIAKSKTPMWL